MAKFICSVCGYVHEGMTAPEKCIICKSPSSQFTLSEEDCKDEDQGTVEDGSINGDVKETQNIGQGQLNVQDVIDEKETNSVDPNISVEDTIIRIAETEGINMAIKWYIDKNSCNTYEAIETVKSICSQKRVYCTLEEEKEILKFDAARLQAVKWYKEKNNCGLKEAKDVVDLVFAKYGKQTIGGNGNGCIITILLAITSTLSFFWLIGIILNC
jgi:ribosomal protein L7/L12/rubredoxin